MEGVSMQQSTVTALNSVEPSGNSNDYHLLPVTEKQLKFARAIAQSTGQVLPWAAQQDRRALSAWINQHQSACRGGRFANYASSKQVAFAERIARTKRRSVPEECIRDRRLMSKWIDCNR